MARYPVLRGLYELDKTIGCGGFAKVKLATHILTGEKVAIKIMEKRGLGEDLPRVRVELEALRTLSHRHISQLFQVLETETHFFLVVEYCSGGELFDHIVEKNRLSERESRAAFRQIVSAVAYLHSLGYVHRDLKPENVLLDKDQNMKLIDFGLCAKPSGGLANFLYTSCGSPTYAAPELVLGKKYLGPEVDVWSMGVLLYALLCGYLPFDDDKIDTLYKKILSGKYEEPSWLSVESRKLIRSMLQVETSKRISVEKILSHPWVMRGYQEPVAVNSHCNLREKDTQCLTLMARHKGISTDEMWKTLSQWKYNYDTATYFLMVNRKSRGLPVRLLGPSVGPVRSYRNRLTPSVDHSADRNDKRKTEDTPKTGMVTPAKRPLADDTTPVIPDKRERTVLSAVNEDWPWTPDKQQQAGQAPPLPPKQGKRAGSVPTSPTKTAAPASSAGSKRGLNKRLHSPGPDESPASPRRAKKDARGGGTPCTTTVTAAVTPERSEPTPGTSRGLLGSIERSLHKVRHILTPRRKLLGEQGGETGAATPAVLSGKGLCNVSTASSDNPEQVLQELQSALHSKGITCRQKGFTLRGKVDADGGRQMSFELEVCVIQTGPVGAGAGAGSAGHSMVGIRRKRLKGDAWCYKRVCEEVLALAAAQQQKT